MLASEAGRPEPGSLPMRRPAADAPTGGIPMSAAERLNSSDDQVDLAHPEIKLRLATK